MTPIRESVERKYVTLLAQRAEVDAAITEVRAQVYILRQLDAASEAAAAAGDGQAGDSPAGAE